MKNILTSLLLCLVLVIQTSCSVLSVKGWSTCDKALFGTYTTAAVIDLFQTREILNNPKWEELNPAYDAGGVDMVAPLAFGYWLGVKWIANKLEGKKRTGFLMTVNVARWSVVNRNDNIEVSLKF